MTRPRKPAKLKVLEGNPGKRKPRKVGPASDAGPEKPEQMSEVASQMWDDVVPHLRAWGLSVRPTRRVLRCSARRFPCGGLFPLSCGTPTSCYSSGATKDSCSILSVECPEMHRLPSRGLLTNSGLRQRHVPVSELCLRRPIPGRRL